MTDPVYSNANPVGRFLIDYESDVSALDEWISALKSEGHIDESTPPVRPALEWFASVQPGAIRNLSDRLSSYEKSGLSGESVYLKIKDYPYLRDVLVDHWDGSDAEAFEDYINYGIDPFIGSVSEAVESQAALAERLASQFDTSLQVISQACYDNIADFEDNLEASLKSHDAVGIVGWTAAGAVTGAALTWWLGPGSLAGAILGAVVGFCVGIVIEIYRAFQEENRLIDDLIKQMSRTTQDINQESNVSDPDSDLGTTDW